MSLWFIYFILALICSLLTLCYEPLVKEYNATMKSLNWNLGYKFLDSGLKGLNVRLFHGMFRGSDVVHKQDRNDVKLLISYSLIL
ncbi:hypothetical protein [Vibrio penaeicida]|uniref:hypothetical protein n=1 Tax=Vibrio penaeicida TaxID=104609 RepID=UPI000CEA489B